MYWEFSATVEVGTDSRAHRKWNSCSVGSAITHLLGEPEILIYASNTAYVLNHSMTVFVIEWNIYCTVMQWDCLEIMGSGGRSLRSSHRLLFLRLIGPHKQLMTRERSQVGEIVLLKSNKKAKHIMLYILFFNKRHMLTRGDLAVCELLLFKKELSLKTRRSLLPRETQCRLLCSADTDDVISAL